MPHSTTETYQMKREILTYCGKISGVLRKPEQKFFADMLYGVLASGSCLLSEISQRLHESTKKINTVDRLSRHLAKVFQFENFRVRSLVAINALNFFLTLVMTFLTRMSTKI